MLPVALLCLLAGIARDNATGSERPVPVDTQCDNLAAPVLVHRVEPKYPEYVRKQRWEGEVVVRAIVGTDGKVSEITVQSSPGKPLSDLVVEAVSQWSYKPAYCKDLEKPIRVYLTVTSRFRLNHK
jgi:TonB family protein